MGVSLLVVLGHEGCGAVNATLAYMFGKMEHPEHLDALVRLIEPGLRQIDPSQPPQNQLQSENRNIRMVGAVYNAPKRIPKNA